MLLNGQGALLILNDVEPADEDDFNLWYDTEHLIERVGIPGFIGASRYRGREGVRRYSALYRTTGLGVFESPAYRHALSLQSDWSRRTLRSFVDPHRAVGTFTASVGLGRGSHMALVKLPPGALGGSDRTTWSEAIIPAVGEMAHVVAAHLFEPEPRLSGPVAEYRPTARPLAAPEDCVLIVEASRREALAWDGLRPVLGTMADGCTPLGSFAFTWGLDHADIDRAAQRSARRALPV